MRKVEGDIFRGYATKVAEDLFSLLKISVPDQLYSCLEELFRVSVNVCCHGAIIVSSAYPGALYQIFQGDIGAFCS